MKVLLSPSKTLNFDTVNSVKNPEYTFDKEVKLILEKTAQLSKNQIQKLMKVSHKIAELNYKRFQEYSSNTAKEAIFAYRGDVYTGLDVDTLTNKEIDKSDNLVLILSGLYGALKPSDLIKPYRLEMRTKLEGQWGHDLYDLWQPLLANYINKNEKEIIINCASLEYSKAIDQNQLKAKWVDTKFLTDKGSGPKLIAVYAKKARGLYARWVIQNYTDDLDITGFDLEAYKYSKKLSTEGELVFIQTIKQK